MKKNNADLYTRQRQSRWAIIFIILKFLYRLLRQLWPLLLAFYLGRSGNSGFERYEIIASGIGIFGMISSIAAYFKYYYHISDTELIIEKGIFKKVKLNLPFERIQSINFHQNILHQLLNVTAVEIESAGSDQKELKIDALTIVSAQNLRQLLLEKKAAIKHSDISIMADEQVTEPAGQNILQLTNSDLLKVGLTQNHLKPIGLLFGLVGSAFGYGFTIGMEPEEIINYVRGNLSDFDLMNNLPLLILLIPLMVLYSILTTFLKHYKLEFVRKGKRFHVVQGLFNKQQFSALDRKIQILSWSQNPFERILGLYHIFFRQAKSGDGRRSEMKFNIPGCNEERIDYVKETWLGKNSGDFDKFFGVSIHYFKRTAIYQSLFYSLVAIVLIYTNRYQGFAILILWWIFSLYLSWNEYKKKRYAINDKELYIGGGILGFKHSIFPLHKIQNLSIKQNPYQWRRDLASLIVYTSAGQVKIPYIDNSDAESLLNQLIYKVEVSKKSWM